MEKEIAVMIPIIFFLVTGIVIATAIFFRSREKQLLIEKGLPPEAIKDFFDSKKDPFTMLKVGLVIFFFGLGLGIGLVLNEETGRDYWVPLLLFTFTGAGFVLANIIANRMNKRTV